MKLSAKTNLLFKGAVSVLVILAFSAISAHAGPIARASFGAGAINFDFTGVANGTAVVTAGNLTVSGGEARNNLFDPAGPMDIQNYTNIGQLNPPPGQILRFDFAAPVSAVGFDVHYNNNPVSFRVFNSSNVLLDSFLGMPNDFGPITGYIGLDVGASLISYALIDVPAVAGHDVYVDNIVYQSVPEPSTLLLLTSGLLGVGFIRRKKA